MARATLPDRLASCLLLLLSCTVAFANEVEQHLRSQYCGKILAERGFFSGEHLRYDSAGTLTGGGKAGDWTTDGFVQINDIQVYGQHLKIRAMRLMVVSGGRNGFEFVAPSGPKKHEKLKKSEVVEIDASTGSDAVSDEVANGLISRIFLNSQDSFADLVPIYWKSCIDQGRSGENDNCRFSAEISSVPGMTTHPRIPTLATEGQSPTNPRVGSNAMLRLSIGESRVGHGISPPRVIHQPEPAFSEPARRMRYQGVVTLAIIVDSEGLPQRIRITNPLGAGLDAKAVEAVSKWKFKPAEKDGQPVAVAIAIEVDFHLY
jgi:TonB family protein